MKQRSSVCLVEDGEEKAAGGEGGAPRLGGNKRQPGRQSLASQELLSVLNEFNDKYLKNMSNERWGGNGGRCL